MNPLIVAADPEISVTSAETEKPTEAPEAEAKTGDAEAKATDEGKSEPEKKSESDDEKPKSRSRAAIRLEETLRQLSAERRKNTRLNREIGRLRAEPMPREEEYADPADYQAAKVTRAVREQTLVRELEDQNANVGELKQAQREVWRDRVSEARTKMPDFDSVFNDNVPVTEDMAEVLVQSELGTELAYYLGKNLDEAHRIAELSAGEQRYHMGRLEGRLAMPKPKQVSSAPKPVTTVGGQAHSPGKTLEEMSYDDYRKVRMEQIKKARGY